MRILVTGGAGFIGSHLVNRLLGEGQTVLCIDNFFTGSRENIQPFLSHPRSQCIEHDIVSPFFTEEKIDQIYNLACPASPLQYQANPVHTMKANTIGVMNMLGVARRHGARFLQASTSEVYGDPEVHPQPETYTGHVNMIGPRACYDEGKRYAETICFDYRRMHGTDIKIVRIFNTYGPRMALNDGRVISNFIVQALRGEPLTIYGDGTQTRSFCYVDDLIEGLTRMMNSDANMTGPVNLGNPDEKSVREIAEKIITLTASSSAMAYKDLPVDDPRRRCPDVTLAKKILGWEPVIGLDDGLRRTIDDFRSRV